MQRDQLLVVSIAARRFRLAHGRWPETIEELTPEFLEATPVDLFTGGPLRLQVESDQVLVVDGGEAEPTGGESWGIIGQFDDRVLRAIWPEEQDEAAQRKPGE